MNIDLAGQRVLVTGGTGFIGGRVVERLIAECNAQVRVLLSRYAGASRIARYPVELVRADITDAQTVKQATADCPIIIHCAYGNRGSAAQRRAVNVAGTRNVLDAAAHHHAQRIVHLSSQAVYGDTADGDLTEDSPRNARANLYGRDKLEAERLAQRAHAQHGLPVTILQPSAVYGPFAPVWTVDVTNLLRVKRMPLIDGGRGICNAIFIEDAVDAILLAATRPEAIGETMLISNPEPITWRDFYSAFEQMIGEPCMAELTSAEVARGAAKHRPHNGLLPVALSLLSEQDVRDRLLRSREGKLATTLLRRMLPQPVRRRMKNAIKRRVHRNGHTSVERVPQGSAHQHEKPIHWLDPPSARFHTAQTQVRIDKARQLLNFQPQFTLADGMRITETWARWANLLPRARRDQLVNDMTFDTDDPPLAAPRDIASFPE